MQQLLYQYADAWASVPLRAHVNDVSWFLKNAKTDADHLFYLRQLVSKLASVKFRAMYWDAYATSVETEVYRRVKSEAVRKPDDIHKIWESSGDYGCWTSISSQT